MYRTSVIALLLMLAGCGGSDVKKEDTAPIVNLSATPTPTATQDLSEALPSETVVESFSSLPKNDLIDEFYYYAEGQGTELEFSQANSDNNKLRVRVAVQGDKACYLATGLSGTDFEMESLVRERSGVWRGLHSKRYFTQPSLNSLVIYGGETDRIASFLNKSIEGDDIRVVQATLASRAIKVENITRLTLPYNVESVYRGQCLNFQPIYFRGKLAKIDSSSQSKISKIESDLQLQTQIPASTVIPTATQAPTVIPTATATPTVTNTPKR